MNRTYYLSWFCLAAAFTLPAENLIFNAGFELGDVGFQCVKYLRMDTNPALRYEGPVADPDSPRSGRFSLHLPNRFAEQTALVLPEVRLEPGAEYTFSFEAKSSLKTMSLELAVVSASQRFGWDGKLKQFAVGKGWRRFDFTFRTAPAKKGEGRRYYGIRFTFCKEVDSPAGDLRLDNLQLNRGGARSWSPAAPVEYAALPDSAVYRRGERAAGGTLVAVNYTAERKHVDIRLLLREERRGNYPEEAGAPRELRREVFDLAPGEKVSQTFPLPELPFGSYELSTSERGGIRLPFVVIGRYTPRPNPRFCFGVNFGGGGFILPPHWEEVGGKTGFRTTGLSPDELASRLAMMGCRVVRDHDPNQCFQWRVVEPEEEKFDFSLGSRVVDTWNRHGIDMLAVVGRTDFINNQNRVENRNTISGFPSWLLARSEPAPTSDYLRRRKQQIYLPPLGDWRRLNRATAAAMRGKIPCYEIINEPNLQLSAETYLTYLRAAAEEIRKADPAAKIVGICSTGDLGGETGSFFAAAIKGGALPVCDAVSFHPYNAPTLGSLLPADAQITDLKRQLAAAGRPETPLWNTELYYLNGRRESAFQSGLCRPEDLVKRLLTDLGEGVARSIPIESSQLFQSVTPHLESSTWCNSFNPNSLYVACNAVARLFEDAEPVRKFKYPYGVVGYLFRRDGTLTAALWNYMERRGIRADLSRFRVMDLFGNPEVSGEKEIGSSPLYLTLPGQSEAEFIALLENLSFQLDRPVSTGELARRAGNRLFINLYNESGRELSGSAGLLGGALIAEVPVRFTIPANGRSVLELPVRSGTGKNTELVLHLGGNFLHYPLRVVENQLLSGKFRLENGSGQLNWDAHSITLEMEVRDSSHAGPAGNRSPWQTDCVELFFDLDPLRLPRRHAQAYTAETFRLFVTPRDTVKLHSQGRIAAEDCRLELSEEASGYRFRLSIPAATGALLGFSCKIDDAAANGGKPRETVLTPGPALYQNRCCFGLISKEEK